LLLKRQGYEVEALFMKNWDEDDEDGYCAAADDLADAERVCAHLDVPLHTVNFSHEYWENVFTRFLHEYARGRTPNPDVLCNREVKFQAFVEHAMGLGADCIATGHYARIARSGGEHRLLAGIDADKDPLRAHCPERRRTPVTGGNRCRQGPELLSLHAHSSAAEARAVSHR
jgi:tRNA-specific 2-thiouridylase